MASPRPQVASTSGSSSSALHLRTPMVVAPDSVARAAGVAKVLYKLDNLQPSGSFKVRGIGNSLARALAAARAEAEAGPASQGDSAAAAAAQLEAVSSSGGNAGMATAWAARELGVGCRVFMPTTTPASTAAKLRALGADVEVAGAVWEQAHAAAEQYCATRRAEGRATLLVHPFEGADVWDGHSTVATEVLEQSAALLAPGERVDAIVCSVGGGGLVSGVLRGLQSAAAAAGGDGFPKPAVVGVETEGAASFAAAVAAGRQVRIGGITSIATTLGSLFVTEEALRMREAYGASRVASCVVSDAEAVSAVAQFLDEQRMLVEPACGASLAAVYQPGRLAEAIKANGGADAAALSPETSVIVVIVCGGSNVTLDALTKWKADFGV